MVETTATSSAFIFTRGPDDVVCVRTTTIDGEPWFLSADACRALGLAANAATVNPKARRVFHADEITVLQKQAVSDSSLLHLFTGTTSQVALLSEAGLYKLILRSEKAEALAFQDWITREVLPSIRKTGSYALVDHGREAMPLPLDIAEAAATVMAVAADMKGILDQITAVLTMHKAISEDDRTMVTARQAKTRGFGGTASTAEIGIALTDFCDGEGIAVGAKRTTKYIVNTYPLSAVRRFYA